MSPFTVLYSTTRMWNPGDDFILFGVRRIVETLRPDALPVVYNRNPDLHMARCGLDRDMVFKHRNSPQFQMNPWRMLVKNWVWRADNSWRPEHNLAGISACVFAGTPEWMGVMVAPLVTALLDRDLPVFYLGLGILEGTRHQSWDWIPQEDRSLLKRARVVTVRDNGAAELLAPINPAIVPCPALMTAPAATVRKQKRRIALSTQPSRQGACQCIPIITQRFSLALFRRLSQDFDCSLVCHYVDELNELRDALPGVPIRYSYDARDYLQIYDDFDLTVTTRVHGAGLCASLGIPSFVISHSERSATARGFLAELLDPSMAVDDAVTQINEFDVAARSASLLEHKERCWQIYLDLLRPHLASTRTGH